MVFQTQATGISIRFVTVKSRRLHYYALLYAKLFWLDLDLKKYNFHCFCLQPTNHNFQSIIIPLDNQDKPSLATSFLGMSHRS
jgi:hypothetical protein